MRRITAIFAPVLAMTAAAVFGFGLVPAVASGLALAAPATGGPTLWVSSATTVTGNGTGCAHPGFNAIQAAVTAAPADATIKVCAGTYTEQLQITGSVTIDGLGNVIVQLPASPVVATTACDTVSGAGSDQDGISICGNNVSVTMNNVVVDAAWTTTVCNDNLYGILVAGGATLSFDNSWVVAAGAYPLNGCQGGIGIEAGMAWTKPVEVGHLNMSDSWVSGYQKNGIVIDGWRSTGIIAHSTVTGAGPTPSIAQNGIQVSDAGRAVITATRVSGNECDDTAASCGANGLLDVQSTGVLFYGAARGSEVVDCRLSYNDIGAYYVANAAGIPVKKPQVTFTGDIFTDNRYEGAVLDQGSASITGSSFSRGAVGIEVLQYSGQNGQTFGSYSVASYDHFADMHHATVDVLSDRQQGDKPGTFTITHSDIYSAKVLDNSKNLPIIHRFDTK